MTQSPRTSLWPIQIVLIVVLLGLAFVGTCTVLVPELEDSGDEETEPVERTSETSEAPSPE